MTDLKPGALHGVLSYLGAPELSLFFSLYLVEEPGVTGNRGKREKTCSNRLELKPGLL